MEDFPVLCVFSENSDLRKLKGDALHFPAGMHCQGSRGRGVVRGGDVHVGLGQENCIFHLRVMKIHLSPGCYFFIL